MIGKISFSLPFVSALTFLLLPDLPFCDLSVASGKAVGADSVRAARIRLRRPADLGILMKSVGGDEAAVNR